MATGLRTEGGIAEDKMGVELVQEGGRTEGRIGVGGFGWGAGWGAGWAVEQSGKGSRKWECYSKIEKVVLSQHRDKNVTRVARKTSIPSRSLHKAK